MPSRDPQSSAPPDDPPGEASIASRTLNILGLALAPLMLAPLIHSWIDGHTTSVVLIALEEVVIFTSLWLNLKERTAAAAKLFVIGAWVVLLGLLMLEGEGSHDIALLAMPAVLIGAGLLVGTRFLLVMTVVNLVGLAVLVVGEIKGWIVNPMSPFTNYGILIDGSVILIITSTAVAVLISDFRRALTRERRNAEALAHSRSELERHADALRRSEHRFRTAIELAADGILLADAEGLVTEANSRACAVLERERHALLGQKIFELLPVGDCESMKDSRARLDRGEPVTCERTIHREHREDVVLEATWQRLPDQSMQCFLRDITARRKLEEQVRHAQKMEAVGAIAGGIAHDFNNLLNVIHGFVELIEEDPALPQELIQNAQELKTASLQAADLTQQMLAYAGRRPLKRRAVDVRDVVASHERLMARLLGTSIEFDIQLPEVPCPAYLDTGAISQVLLNLAANARDAMPKGGQFSIAVLAPEPRTPRLISARAVRPGAYIGLRARDSGPGVPPEIASRVFEPFFTTKPTGKGTGLGLAMVHGIVEHHGGWVELHSQPEFGAEFTVFLPVFNPPEARPESAPFPVTDIPATGGSRETILVVDDDPSMRRIAATALKRHGYTVAEAGSGPEALNLWTELGGRVDLLFTDMVMPGGMTGLQLVDACRDRKPGLRAVVASGYSRSQIREESSGHGEIVHLSKPYVAHVLTETIRTALSNGR